MMNRILTVNREKFINNCVAYAVYVECVLKSNKKFMQIVDVVLSIHKKTNKFVITASAIIYFYAFTIEKTIKSTRLN